MRQPQIEGQLDLFTDTDAALARSTDPETSHEAAASVEGLRARQRQVLEALRLFGPMHDDSLIVAVASLGHRQSPSGIRSRRNELVQHGLVAHTGDYRRTRAGRRSRVWHAVGNE